MTTSQSSHIKRHNFIWKRLPLLVRYEDDYYICRPARNKKTNRNLKKAARTCAFRGPTYNSPPILHVLDRWIGETELSDKRRVTAHAFPFPFYRLCFWVIYFAVLLLLFGYLRRPFALSNPFHRLATFFFTTFAAPLNSSSREETLLLLYTPYKSSALPSLTIIMAASIKFLFFFQIFPTLGLFFYTSISVFYALSIAVHNILIFKRVELRCQHSTAQYAITQFTTACWHGKLTSQELGRTFIIKYLKKKCCLNTTRTGAKVSTSFFYSPLS